MTVGTSGARTGDTALDSAAAADHDAHMAAGMRGVLTAALELAVPVECGGCRRPGTPWCPRCAAAVRDDPVVLRPRVEIGVPAWATGRYRGPLRTAVVDLKEHRRADLVPVLGAVLARSLLRLAEWEAIVPAARLALVPAPTRVLSARRRGGDPVTALARDAAARLGPRVAAVPLLTIAPWTRDSAGLSAGGRLANLQGAVRLVRRPPPALRAPHPGTVVLLVDDVLTTGATAASAVTALEASGVAVSGVVVLAGA